MKKNIYGIVYYKMAEGDKKSLADMRKELRELRKTHVKPISKLRKGDIASEIQRLAETRATVAPVASTPMAPAKTVRSAAESIKEAKASEFPVKPMAEKKAKAPASGKAKKAPAAAPKKSSKSDKLARLLALMEEESESDRE